MTIADSNRIRLGVLMIDAGLIDRVDFERCLQMARETGLPVGRVLLISRQTTEAVLQASVQAQSLLKDGIIELQTAYSALRLVKSQEVALDRALIQLGINVAEVQINKLGELLLKANYVSEEELEKALLDSRSTGLPFGRMLVLEGVISESQLAATLNAQILLRDGKITREQAIQGLKQARRRQIAVEVPLMEKGYYKVQTRNSIRLGELLSLAGLVSETQLLNAVELGLTSRKPLGQILVELKLVSPETIKTALQIQELVVKGTISPMDATKVLLRAEEAGCSIAEAVASLEKAQRGRSEENNLSLREFLLQVNTVTMEDIESAFELSTSNNQILGRMLLLSGIIEESTLQAALRLVAMVKAGALDIETAGKVFNESQRARAGIDEILACMLNKDNSES